MSIPHPISAMSPVADSGDPVRQAGQAGAGQLDIGEGGDHGDRCVELDALPVDALRQRIRDEIESRMDLDALRAVDERSARERAAIRAAIEAAVKEAG